MELSICSFPLSLFKNEFPGAFFLFSVLSMLGREIRTHNLVIANILSSDSMPVLTALYALFYFIPAII